MKKVTVITPAWNTEQYIGKAIESCLEQDYEALEILIIDDGSTDKTVEVVRQYQERDSRIQLFMQNHKGVSAARNLGLEKAAGQFILFLDSDDWLEPNTIRELVDLQEQYCDYLISCNTYLASINKDGSIKQETTHMFDNPVVLTQIDALKNTGNAIYHNSSVNKIFKTDVIKENQIIFHQDITSGEDGLFVFEYLLHTSGMVYIDKPYWNIFNRAGSSTRYTFAKGFLTSLVAVDRMLEMVASYDEALQHSLRAWCVVKAKNLYKRYALSDNIREDDIICQLRLYVKKYQKEYCAENSSLYEKMKLAMILIVPFGVYRNVMQLRKMNGDNKK